MDALTKALIGLLMLLAPASFVFSAQHCRDIGSAIYAVVSGRETMDDVFSAKCPEARWTIYYPTQHN